MSYHHGNLKEALIQKADEELKAHGPESLSLREVAKRAGVSHNAPYRHFRDKADLLNQILERTLAELAEQILSAPLLYPASVQLQVQYVGRLWAFLAARHPRKAQLLFSGLSQSDEQRSLINAGHKIVLANFTYVLEEAKGREIRIDTDCITMSLLLLSTFRGLGALFTSNTAADLLPDEDALYEMSDLAAENLLLSVLV